MAPSGTCLPTTFQPGLLPPGVLRNVSYNLIGYAITPVPKSGCNTLNAANEESMYSFHIGGVNVARGDGSVAFLRSIVAPTAIAALLTRAGEVVPGDTW